ncbi:MAG: alkaline phosphatase, partial [Pseudomonadota bacterium]
IVTSTRLTHATPAALYAHSPERNWEDDSSVPAPAQAAGCRDIAAQLLDPRQGDGPEVMLGGGRANFLPVAEGGRRRDGRDLLASWVANGDLRHLIHTRQELLDTDSDGQLLGVFSDSHLPYEQLRDEQTTAPNLREMTEAALDRLSASQEGYLLMVEGGRIDHAHHEGVAGRALSELVAFDEAIAATLARVDLRETLVLVTADHSHVLAMAGYPTRNNPILGLVVGNDPAGNPLETPAVDAEGTPYTTLGYLNGPGAVDGGERPVPETGPEAVQHALIATGYVDSRGESVLSETHAGEDVVLYAGGPWAHLARGVMEQNLIFDLITWAYGWSPSP